MFIDFSHEKFFTRYFLLTSCNANGIVCCVTHFNVSLSIELSVALYPELVEGSLTSLL